MISVWKKLALFKTEVDTARAVLVGVDTGREDFSDSMAELSLLADSAGSIPAASVIARKGRMDPALFIGSGKANELKRAMEEHGAELAIFNHPLSPTQQRNLERHIGFHVMDRTGLILDIFSQRAQSYIGKTQVELAQVRYRMSRLVRAWSHLERQRGGIGVRGGPGETQMELDRRMLATKAKRLENELEKLQRQKKPKGVHEIVRMCFPFLWWATRMRANLPCLMPLPKQGHMPPTSCLPPLTLPLEKYI